VLQQAVSNQLTWLTQFYNHCQGPARERPAEFSYRNLDERRLRRCPRVWPRATARFRRKLRHDRPHCHFLVYEELFGPDKDLAVRRERPQRVPGIEDIERKFGSDRTGWLFR
jgi:hypothetical protein